MHGVAGLLVGAIVGITGVGGGALMTPILVLLFGIAPTTAVGTDLLYASITKMFGTAVHHRAGTVDWSRSCAAWRAGQPAGRGTDAGVDALLARRPGPQRPHHLHPGPGAGRHGAGHPVQGADPLARHAVSTRRQRALQGDAAVADSGVRRAAGRDGDAHLGGRRRARHRHAGLPVSAAAQRGQAGGHGPGPRDPADADRRPRPPDARQRRPRPDGQPARRLDPGRADRLLDQHARAGRDRCARRSRSCCCSWPGR